MKKLAIRFALTITLLLFAAPMFAQEYGCYDCRSTGTGDALYLWCDHPENESWGWDQDCQWLFHNGAFICRRVGSRCYYFEVYG